jgi:hypothetical protein
MSGPLPSTRTPPDYDHGPGHHPVGTDNAIKIHNVSADTVDYILDLEGWYQNFQTPTISCPGPYMAGSWTMTLPTQPIDCTVHVSATGDPAGELDLSVNGGSELFEPLPDTSAGVYPIEIPAVEGWYDIAATANFSNGIETELRYSFGIWNGAPSATLGAIQQANAAEFENLTTTSTSSAEPVAVDAKSADDNNSLTVATDPAVGLTLATGSVSSADRDDGSTDTVPRGERWYSAS